VSNLCERGFLVVEEGRDLREAFLGRRMSRSEIEKFTGLICRLNAISFAPVSKRITAVEWGATTRSRIWSDRKMIIIIRLVV
jgi:hypothetical protein